MKSLKIISVALSLTLAACASVAIKSQWKDPVWQGPPISSVLVYAATENTLRSLLEDAFVEKLVGAGAKAERSYRKLPPAKTPGDLLDVAKADGTQAIVVMRLLDFEFATDTWRDSRGSGLRSAYDGPWLKTDQYSVVKIETSVWDANTGKLVWTATTDRVVTRNIQEGAQDIAATFVSKLKTDGIIR